MILTRRQFAKMFNGVKDGLGKWDSPLWIPETMDKSARVKCQWFICIKPVWMREGAKEEYWKWCNENLTGKVLCYSSSGSDREIQEEWWGFSDKQDLTWWRLRWE